MTVPSRPIELGLSLPNRAVLYGGTTVEELLKLSEAADRDPAWSSVWVGDGLIAKPRLEAVTTLAAMAARTTRVRLGVCCLATFPLRQPVLFAATWASLDVLSSGRTQLAVCLGAPTGRGGGDFRVELDAMGVSPGERVARLEEGIEVLRCLWSSRPGAAASFDGRFTGFGPVVLEPHPVQDPCPIWIASNPDPDRLSPERYLKAIDRVAIGGDGWQTAVTDPETFGRQWDRIRERAADYGRDPAALCSSAHLMITVADTVEDARREGKAFLDRYYGMDTSPEVMDRWGAYGDADIVAARILDYVDRGLDVPILRMACGEQTAMIERVRAEVVPQLGVAA